MDKQPTEARQDELAGIREKIVVALDDIYRVAYGNNYEEISIKASILIKADQILSLTVSSGQCKKCNGTGLDFHDRYCVFCKGTGVVEKTLGEIIKEWEDGN